MDTVTVCETCGSENVRSRFDGVGFCEDCDAPCTTVEVVDDDEAEVGDYVRCCMCSEVVHVTEDTLALAGVGGRTNWYCDMCE